MLARMDHHTARALLEWQVELGVTEAIAEAPVNRYDAPEVARPGPAPAVPAAPATTAPILQAVDPVDAARAAAETAADLDGLAAAIAAFDLCDLKRGARNTVFADGRPGARVMVIGEAPGRDEDIEGRPFVGRAGQLLDRMFAAVGMARDATDLETAIYITNVMPWRPPQNREPTPGEIAMLRPFVERHVALADPDVLVLMGNAACACLLQRRGIGKLRGNWQQVLGRPAMPMFHPSYLLRTPSAKREAWADLLSLRAKLSGDT